MRMRQGKSAHALLGIGVYATISSGGENEEGRSPSGIEKEQRGQLYVPFTMHTHGLGFAGPTTSIATMRARNM